MKRELKQSDNRRVNFKCGKLMNAFYFIRFVFRVILVSTRDLLGERNLKGLKVTQPTVK